MGITSNCSKFLFYAGTQGVSYRETLMLGRQHLYARSEDVLDQAIHFDRRYSGPAISFDSGFAEPLFQLLGAGVIDSLDISPYEGATIIHDLGKPVKPDMESRYSAIVDGGTLEHIYDFPTAITNCIRMLKIGGHFISITPANNQCGHGFYQFSPELFFSIFRRERGLALRKLLVAVDTSDGDREWFEVADPRNVKQRVMFRNEHPSYLMIIATKLEEQVAPIGDVYQSDYETAWVTLPANSGGSSESALKRIYRRTVPKGIRDSIRQFLFGRSGRTRSVAHIGMTIPDHFRRLDV